MADVSDTVYPRKMPMDGIMNDRSQDVDGPTISVVMPAYNCPAMIESSLLPLLQMQRCGDVFEIIVVDDGSTDNTAEVAARLGATVILNDGTRGPGSARNRGVQSARGEIVWFVDSDVVVKADAAQRIRRALASREFVAVVGSYDEFPRALNFFSQYKNLVHHHYHQNNRGDLSTFWAGCGAVWKDAFTAAGGFDELRYPRPSIEDIELGYRLNAAGGRIRLVRELQGTHLKVWTMVGLFRTEVRDRAIPWSLLLLSRGRLGDELNVAMTERVRALLAGLVMMALVGSAIGLMSWQIPGMLLVAALMANLELFALFQRRNGVLFAFGGVLFHQIYYLYSTAAYGLCWFAVKWWKPFAIRFHLASFAGATKPSI